MVATGSLCIKDPDATLWPKGIDWTDYCTERSTTITGSAWAITGTDSALTKSAETIVTGNLKTQLKLSGGTVGLTYTVTNSITTAAGGTDDRSFLVLIEQR
jgi:hypothetical protein